MAPLKDLGLGHVPYLGDFNVERLLEVDHQGQPSPKGAELEQHIRSPGLVDEREGLHADLLGVALRLRELLRAAPGPEAVMVGVTDRHHAPQDASARLGVVARERPGDRITLGGAPEEHLVGVHHLVRPHFTGPRRVHREHDLHPKLLEQSPDLGEEGVLQQRHVRDGSEGHNQDLSTRVGDAEELLQRIRAFGEPPPQAQVIR
mmetsp:Transcript_6674/g.18695  ORF Transcript_6674/g.18695 Transcript_6674/m.18695 type:complete len:204 (-) Transcript_6674:260-871(-)